MQGEHGGARWWLVGTRATVALFGKNEELLLT